MSIIDTINKLDKRYGWSLLGFLLAAIFGGISFYTEFIRDHRAQLRFEVISDASVLDVREQLGNLEIIYDGRDIKKAKQSLRVVIVRITNVGAADVLIGHYDQHSPLGFTVTGGNLLRAEILSASNQYLLQTLHIDTEVINNARFSPVIMESNEWFTVKSLIIHAEGVKPTLQAMGKIAGVREIRIVDSTEATESPGFLSIAFSGGIWVQAVRLVPYTILFILLMVVVIAPFAGISGFLSKRRRRKHVSSFKSLTKRSLSEKDEYIFERYIQNDIHYLLMLRRALLNEDRLKREAERFQKRERDFEQKWVEEPDGIVFSSSGAPPQRLFRFGLPIGDMMKAGFIFQQGDEWTVNPDLSATLNEFIQFLRIKGIDYPEVKFVGGAGAEPDASADAQRTSRG